jgi:hypothetical protein
MLHQVYNLCDDGEPLDNEVCPLNNAFIAHGYHPKDVDQIISSYEKDNNEEAKHRCDTICIPYVRGPSDSLRKQLAKEEVNLIFKRGKTLRQFLFNGEPKKSDRRKNVCYQLQVPCLTVHSVTLGKPHSGGMNGKSNTSDVHLKDNPDHVIGWDKVSFMAFDSRYSHRRMKESFLIDIFAYRGIMNIEDGMKKDACWNVLFPSLRKDFPELRGI